MADSELCSKTTCRPKRTTKRTQKALEYDEGGCGEMQTRKNINNQVS